MAGQDNSCGPAGPVGSAFTYPLVGLYALMLSAAGLPLYIHLPQFAAVELGINLGALGVILLAIRLFDLLQDPVIGWAIDRWPGAQGAFAGAAALGLAAGFPLLFGLERGEDVAPRLVVTLLLLYTAYSLGSILLYSRSTSFARRPGADELVVVATYREGARLRACFWRPSRPPRWLLLGQGRPATRHSAWPLALSR
ncbi:MFS transporter [Gemmobacter lanyuensis]